MYSCIESSSAYTAPGGMCETLQYVTCDMWHVTQLLSLAAQTQLLQACKVSARATALQRLQPAAFSSRGQFEWSASASSNITCRECHAAEQQYVRAMPSTACPVCGPAMSATLSHADMLLLLLLTCCCCSWTYRLVGAKYAHFASWMAGAHSVYGLAVNSFGGLRLFAVPLILALS
jgi:hypothetical protein